MIALVETVATIATTIAIALLIRRRGINRPAWLALGAAFSAFAVAAFARSIDQRMLSNVLIAIGSVGLALSASLSLASDRRSRWTINESIDSLSSLLICVLCGWEFVLRPLHVSNADGTALLCGIVVVIALIIVRICAVLTDSRRGTIPIAISGL